jgi:copper chaperone CopZ
LREWADSHAYDTSCATCANEVTTNLNNNMPEDKAKEVLLQCLYREADAFINKNKSTLPISGSKIVKQETDVCGTTDVKVTI